MSKTTDNRTVTRRRDSTETVSRSWASFSRKLTLVLSKLDKGQYLILSSQNGKRYLQFACLGKGGMRVEVSSNQCLKLEDRLNRQQISWLRANGWNAPTRRLNQGRPYKNPHGSPNYFVDLPATVVAGEVAHLAMEALALGLEIPNPASLAYEAFAANGRELCFEGIGTKRSILEGRRLMKKVLEVFRHVTGIAKLKLDEDGNVLVFHRGRPVYAMPLEKKVCLSSPLATGEIETPALLHKLNELNLELSGLRCVFRGGTVFASFDIQADPFIPEHLELAIKEISETAEKLALLLCDVFSGKGRAKTRAATRYLQ